MMCAGRVVMHSTRDSSGQPFEILCADSYDSLHNILLPVENISSLLLCLDYDFVLITVPLS